VREKATVAQMVTELSRLLWKTKTLPCSLDSASGPSVESHKTFAKYHILFLN
jgi:hypothetical protein